jgi:hypothetical protein
VTSSSAGESKILRSLRPAWHIAILLVGGFLTCAITAYALRSIGISVDIPGIQFFLACSLAALIGAFVFGFGREFSAFSSRARIWFWWPTATLVGTAVLVAIGAVSRPNGAAVFAEFSPAILFGAGLGVGFAWCEHLGIKRRVASPNKSLERTRGK